VVVRAERGVVIANSAIGAANSVGGGAKAEDADARNAVVKAFAGCPPAAGRGRRIEVLVPCGSFISLSI